MISELSLEGLRISECRAYSDRCCRRMHPIVSERISDSSIVCAPDLARELGLVLKRIMQEEFSSSLQTILLEIQELKNSISKIDTYFLNFEQKSNSRDEPELQPATTSRGRSARNITINHIDTNKNDNAQNIQESVQSPVIISDFAFKTNSQHRDFFPPTKNSSDLLPLSLNRNASAATEYTLSSTEFGENRNHSPLLAESQCGSRRNSKSSSLLRRNGSLKSQSSHSPRPKNSGYLGSSSFTIASPPPAQEGATMYGRMDVARKVPACGCGRGNGMAGRALRMLLEKGFGVSDPNIWVGHPGSSLIHPSSPFSTGELPPHLALRGRPARDHTPRPSLSCAAASPHAPP